MPFVAGNIYWITYNFIDPIHEKISLCVCPERPLFFWINSIAKSHGIGQLLIQNSICTTFNHDSYLDLSSVKTGSEVELQTARDVGQMSVAMKALILSELQSPNKLLPQKHRTLALRNLNFP